MVDRANANDLSHAMIGIKGIFWALNMLVIEKLADNVASEESRMNGIASLIVAGEVLAQELTERS